MPRLMGPIGPHRKIRVMGRQPPLAPGLMHPTLISRAFHHAGWIYEETIDGYRMVAHKVGGACDSLAALAATILAASPSW